MHTYKIFFKLDGQGKEYCEIVQGRSYNDAKQVIQMRYNGHTIYFSRYNQLD